MKSSHGENRASYEAHNGKGFSPLFLTTFVMINVATEYSLLAPTHLQQADQFCKVFALGAFRALFVTMIFTKWVQYFALYILS